MKNIFTLVKSFLISKFILKWTSLLMLLVITSTQSFAQTPCINQGYATEFICPGGSVFLSGGCIFPTPIPACSHEYQEYRWFRDGFFVGSSLNHLATLPGNYTFVVEYHYHTSGVFGLCVNPGVTTISSPSKAILPATPTVISSVTSINPLPLCPGGSTTLQVNGTLQNHPTAQWVWYSNGCGNQVIGTGPTVIVSPVVNTTYYVRSQSSCGNSTCASILIPVNSLAAPTAATASASTVCPGAPSTLTVHGIASGSHIIEWSIDPAFSQIIATGQFPVVNPTQTTTYHVRYNYTLCGVQTAAQSVTVNVEVPVISCRNLTVILDANGQASIPTDVNTSQMTAITKGFLAGVCPNPAVPGPTCDCPDGYVVTGYSADKGNGWGANVISRYKLHCTELLPNGTLGANTTITCENGSASGTSTSSANAAAGEVLVGMQIRIGCAIDAVTGFSKSIAGIVANTANTTSNMMTSIGGTGGSLQTAQYAPDGHVIVGMQTYTDNSIAAGVAWRYAPISEVMNLGGTVLSNCGALITSFSQSAFDCSQTGSNTVIYTVTDSYGNSNTCSFTVTVIDDQAPTIVCPSDIVLSSDPGVCGANIIVAAPVVTDNCSSFSPGPEMVSNGNLTQNHINWNNCGNGVEAYCAEPCYGGSNNSNLVAEIDHAPVTLCQNISGFTIGKTYTLSFLASRRIGAPATVGALVSIDGGALNTSVNRSNTTFELTSEEFTFVATQSTHQLSFVPTAGWSGTLGLIIDDISIKKVNGTIVNSFNNTADASGSYPEGSTTVIWTVTDENGNSATCSQTITVNDTEAPTITCPVDVEFCYDTPVIIGNATATDNCGTPVITNDATGIYPPGVTTVVWTATDAAGISTTCTQLVTVHQLNGIATVEDVLCYGENTGSITITPFSIPSADPNDLLYSLDVGITTQASNVFDELYAGLYTVTMINTATNCEILIDVTVNEPSSAVSASVTTSSASCYGVSTGTATALGSGGTGGYTYEWFDDLNTKVSTNDFAGLLSPGSYTVVVTDANGCTATATTVITELPEIIVDLGLDKTVFYGALGFNGCHTLTPTIVGATAPLNYSWSSTNSDPAIAAANGSSLNVCVTSDIMHTYTVLVTDANGCTGSATVSVIYANIDCSNQQNAGKVTICNVPSGNPLNCKTICVSVNAAAAILANGGYVGPCLPNCAQPTARVITSAPVVSTMMDLNVYPNPASTSVTIEYASDNNDAQFVIVTDLQGRIIEKIDIYGAFEFKGNLDLSAMENGIYFINITNNRSVLKSAKVVKSE